MLSITSTLSLPEDQIEIHQIRATGPGGQNVNKVATGVHLRFNIRASSLPSEVKLRLLAMGDQRLTKEGVIVIKAHRHRSYEKNKSEALERLTEFIRIGTVIPKKRRPTRPSKAAKKKRVDGKTKRGKLKDLRKKIL